MINPNEPTQSEKREVLRNDTLFARQQNTIDDAGGRYSKLNPTKITGTTPASYPQQPANSPWASDPVPPEDPLGFSVDETPPNSGGGQSNVVVGVASSSPADNGSMAPPNASLGVEPDPTSPSPSSPASSEQEAEGAFYSIEEEMVNV